MFTTLLAALDLAGAVVTADAMHTQREHAGFLVTEKNAHYILAVKNNQPSLYAQLKSLPWRQVPIACDTRERGHGRAEWRTLKMTAVASGIAFAHAAQAIQIRRRRRPLSSRNQPAMVYRNQLRRHPPGRQPGHPRPSRRLDPRPLGHRSPPPHPFSRGSPG